MKKSKGHPGDDVRKRHIAFIQANWDQLAAEAYKGYIEHGRGMLVLSDDQFIDKPVGVLVKYGMGYMTEGSDIYVAAGNEWPGDKEAKWVSEYDPNRTMLVAVMRTDDGISSYRVDGVDDGTPELSCKRSFGGQN